MGFRTSQEAKEAAAKSVAVRRAKAAQRRQRRERTPPPDLERFVGYPVRFFEALVDPDTGKPFRVYPAQREFIERAFAPTGDGLAYSELVFSAPKKSGKSTVAAVILLYTVRVLGGRFAEGYAVANDLEQAQGRVFAAVRKIIEVSPLLRGTAKVLKDRVEFSDTGAMIQALASDYAGAAGVNPSCVVFDELWGYVSESARRLWDELVPVPTRPVSVRLTTTYSGFEGESTLLEELRRRGLQGLEVAPALWDQPGMLMAWHQQPVAPWQTPEWLAQMREQLRPSAYTRMILNEFTAGESGFVDMMWWDACVDPEARPVPADQVLPVWVGVDASTKRDSTAIVAVTWDEPTKRVRLVRHRIFQPTPDDPLDFEATIERTLLEWRSLYQVRAVRYDPYQLVALAQRLTRAGLPMREFPQSVPNLTEASSNLYELIKGRNLVAYADEEIRRAVSHAVAVENVRGWRIAKTKAAQRIDVVVALAMAALPAVQQGQRQRGDPLAGVVEDWNASLALPPYMRDKWAVGGWSEGPRSELGDPFPD